LHSKLRIYSRKRLHIINNEKKNSCKRLHNFLRYLLLSLARVVILVLYGRFIGKNRPQKSSFFAYFTDLSNRLIINALVKGLFYLVKEPLLADKMGSFISIKSLLSITKTFFGFFTECRFVLFVGFP